MKFHSIILCCVTLAPAVMAGAIKFNFRLGETVVTQNQRQIVIHAQTPVAITILPGGKTWPTLSLDEGGRIYAGGAVIEATSGRQLSYLSTTQVLPHDVDVNAKGSTYRFRRAGKECYLSLKQLRLGDQKNALDALKDANLVFSSSPTALLALATQFGPDGRVGNYLVERIDVDRCRATVEHHLGNPDLLVELAHSTRGGWWITGSIEQTLLQSNDGRQWRKVNLPTDLSSLISSYIVDKNEIWLAAILPDEDELSPHLLVYSGDGGRSWRNLVAYDPLLAKVPAGWLEGQRRRAPRDKIARPVSH